MNKTALTNTALAIAVSLPAIVTPAIAFADQQRPATVQLAQATKAATPANAKNELMAELRRLTPEQKREIGQNRINRVSQFSGNEIVQAGCFTQGVGCQGTSGFTNGVLCCVIKKIGI